MTRERATPKPVACRCNCAGDRVLRAAIRPSRRTQRVRAPRDDFGCGHRRPPVSAANRVAESHDDGNSVRDRRVEPARWPVSMGRVSRLCPLRTERGTGAAAQCRGGGRRASRSRAPVRQRRQPRGVRPAAPGGYHRCRIQDRQHRAVRSRHPVDRSDDRRFRARRITRDSVQATLARVRAATASLPHPTVFIPAWDKPIIAIGGGSFMSELLEVAGARNVYADISAPSATGDARGCRTPEPGHRARRADIRCRPCGRAPAGEPFRQFGTDA